MWGKRGGSAQSSVRASSGVFVTDGASDAFEITHRLGSYIVQVPALWDSDFIWYSSDGALTGLAWQLVAVPSRDSVLVNFPAGAPPAGITFYWQAYTTGVV